MKTLKLVPELLLRLYGALHRANKNLYVYRPQKYAGTFLGLKKNIAQASPAEKVVYCFWTGANEMPENRIKNLNLTKKNIKVPLKIITKDSLDSYVKPNFPLHPAYPYLSDVHKADYLRCYFMHHYGGGYTDVKKHSCDWSASFERLNADPAKIGIGYRELYWAPCEIPNPENDPSIAHLNKDLQRHYAYLLGNGSFIFKPYTTFTQEWMDELHARLDKLLKKLEGNPGNTYGDNENYPVPWTYLLGQIFHPLCLKYHRHLLVDNQLIPELKNYR